VTEPTRRVHLMQHGDRFAPAPLLVDMAKTNKKFHN
jgi:hypothetical protein